MRAIVTGGAGFIGSHLTELLLEKGHFVLVLDNFSTGRKENLAHLEDNPNLKLVQIDVSEFDKIKGYFKEIDWVFHLAALADIVPSVVEPLKYLKNNIDSVDSVLEASRQAGVKRFIYAASSSCYGLAKIFPTPETSPISPEYPYALTKYVGEQIALHWHRVYKLPVVSLRLFNVYGPRSRTSGTYGAMFGVFLAQRLAGKPYTVVGDGTQTRDFTFVKDISRAFLSAAESDIAGEIFNVGSGGICSVNRIIELLGGGAVVHIPKRPGEPDCTFGDISKIKRMLGWQPAISLEEGIKILLDNIDYWKKAPVWTPESIAEATKEWFRLLGNK
ncbi:MAG: SDR family oxidoreductase [Candidatus Wildermuthbacteria bacterium]|nr:SDR family oxidoreductase [Candidatus Wildermuthbacteria bacterium]